MVFMCVYRCVFVSHLLEFGPAQVEDVAHTGRLHQFERRIAGTFRNPGAAEVPAIDNQSITQSINREKTMQLRPAGLYHNGSVTSECLCK